MGVDGLNLFEPLYYSYTTWSLLNHEDHKNCIATTYVVMLGEELVLPTMLDTVGHSLALAMHPNSVILVTLIKFFLHAISVIPPLLTIITLGGGGGFTVKKKVNPYNHSYVL